MTTKLETRQKALSRIKASPQTLVNWQPVINQLTQFDSVALYMPLAGEIDLKPLQLQLERSNVTVAYPTIQSGEMVMVNNTDGQPFVNEHGFLQPQSGDVIVPDLIICPVLAIDNQGYRLGRGGGYYDRYLSLHTLQCFAMAYDWQTSLNFSPDIWDMPLDGCFLVDKSGNITQKNY